MEAFQYLAFDCVCFCVLVDLSSDDDSAYSWAGFFQHRFHFVTTFLFNNRMNCIQRTVWIKDSIAVPQSILSKITTLILSPPHITFFTRHIAEFGFAITATLLGF